MTTDEQTATERADAVLAARQRKARRTVRVCYAICLFGGVAVGAGYTERWLWLVVIGVWMSAMGAGFAQKAAMQ